MTEQVTHHDALLRHLADLRDGNHGGATTRADKEQLFVRAVELLDPVARQVLDEMNDVLLLGSGTVLAHGVTAAQNGGLHALWTLSWQRQAEAAVQPVIIRAHYGRGFHHPHLSGGTVGGWPLNVFDEAQAMAELPTLRAIATADLHNLVFQADYRIVPAAT